MGRPHSGKLYRVQSKRQSFSFVQLTRRTSPKRTDTGGDTEYTTDPETCSEWIVRSAGQDPNGDAVRFGVGYKYSRVIYGMIMQYIRYSRYLLETPRTRIKITKDGSI